MSALAYSNPRVQQLRRLIGRRSSRHEHRRFVVEGPVLVAEAVAAGWDCESQFVAAEADGVVQPGVDGAGPVFELAEGVLERVASTETPQNPIAVVRMRDWGPARELLAEASFVVVLDRIADPGNLGTVLRSAEAAGADLVVLTPGSVDPFNPKVVRSSAGALFHVPIIETTIDEVGAAALVTIGTTSHDVPVPTVAPYTRTDLTGRIAIVLGNEAAGLPAEWTDESGPIRRWTTIPHVGRSESLNVAMAATVLVFEAARQRAAAHASSSTPNEAG
jgi:TrmH family RNA methyltransferase